MHGNNAFPERVLKEQKLLFDAAASKLPLAFVFRPSFPTSDSVLKNIKEHYFFVLVL